MASHHIGHSLPPSVNTVKAVNNAPRLHWFAGSHWASSHETVVVVVGGGSANAPSRPGEAVKDTSRRKRKRRKDVCIRYLGPPKARNFFDVDPSK